MLKLTKQEYDLLDKKLPHIVIYTINGCWVCDAQIGNPFFKRKAFDCYVIECTKEELENLGITATPLTQVISSSGVVFNQGGILYPSQMEKLETCIKTEKLNV